MGKRQRNRQRAEGLRVGPNEPKPNSQRTRDKFARARRGQRLTFKEVS